MISVRALAANGKSVPKILEGVDMADPEANARAVAEMRLLEEAQHNAVLAKARELSVAPRIDGPNGKVSTIYDFRDDTPLYRTTSNVNAAISSGANLLAPAPYSLNGSGVRIGIWDGGSVRATHQELTGRITKKNASATDDNHATHVAGTIAATGVNAAAKGMAPLTNIDSYDWDSDYSEMTAAAITGAGDVTKLPMSNHSYGYEAATADMGRYETEAAAVDAVAASLPYYLVYWAAGNEQDTLTAKGGYQSITFNGLAKNIITIGAAGDAVSGGVRNPSVGTITYFSSLGPCDDGRIKPDVVANGEDLTSSVARVGGTDTGALSNTTYDVYSGTSMATPSALGSSVLLAQLYAREFSGQRMRASMLKGLLIHTATDVGTVGPDYKYGWGYINVKAASDLILAHKSSLIAPKMIEGGITAASGPKTHTFIWDGVSPIRATLCWTDPAGTAQTGQDSRTPNLKHNLDAKITAPNGTTNYNPYVMPFVGSWTTASMATAATTGKNNVDNVEQVYVSSPSQNGTYTVTVSLDGSLTTASQAYSLIITGGTEVESNPPPTVALTAPTDGSSYLPGATVTVSATATDMAIGGNPGSVTQVEFFAGSTSLGVDTSAPYSVSWTAGTGGTYAITAKATDNEGAVATSTISTINVLTGDGVPVISLFSPASGGAGSLVILSGSNFVGVTSVKFNGVDAVFTVDSAGQITATVPNTATTGTITVTNGYGTGTSATPFTVVQSPILISQVYGAGGNSGSVLNRDYVELYNRSEATVDITGWSVQYASKAGSSWQATALSGSIPAGKYFLVALASGSSGTALPTPDVSGSIAMSATDGKVALRNTATSFSASSPEGQAGLQDFVGFGTANAYEGTAAAPAPSTSMAIFRAGGGATDSNDNSADFTSGAPNPRNLSSGPAVTPVITSALTATGTANAAFNYQITASGSPASYGATPLPAGLVVNTSTGAITGTPTTAGTTNITISATNVAGTGSGTLVLTVNPSGGGGPSNNILVEDFVSITNGNSTNSSGSPTAWTGNTNFPTVTSAYQAGGAVKLGTGSLTGSITSKPLDLSVNGGVFKVTFKVKGWTNIEGNIKVTVTGLPPQTVTYTSVLAGSFETKTLDFTGGTANSTVKFETTAKRAFLDDIAVFYESSSVSPLISATGTLATVSTTYGTASPTPTSFLVSGTDITGGILVTPPAGFEVSQASGGTTGYAATQTVGSTGTVAATTVYLRLSAGTTAGSYSGSVVVSSAGASSVNLSAPTSEVNLKLMSITANNLGKPYGTTLTLGTGQTGFIANGLVGTETVGSVTLTASGGLAANDAPGAYILTPSAATGGTFNPGNYDIDYVAGSLTVTAATFSDWAGGYSLGGLTGTHDDPDHDGIPNAIENILGTAPDTTTAGLTLVSSSGGNLVFRHSRSNTPASDLVPSYEWSADMVTWHVSGASDTGTTVTLTPTTITDNVAPANDLVEVTAAVTGTPKPKIFARLKAVK